MTTNETTLSLRTRPWAQEVPRHRPLTVAEIVAIHAYLERTWLDGVSRPEDADLDRLVFCATAGSEDAWLTHHARRAVVAALAVVSTPKAPSPSAWRPYRAIVDDVTPNRATVIRVLPDHTREASHRRSDQRMVASNRPMTVGERVWVTGPDAVSIID